MSWEWADGGWVMQEGPGMWVLLLLCGERSLREFREGTGRRVGSAHARMWAPPFPQLLALSFILRPLSNTPRVSCAKTSALWSGTQKSDLPCGPVACGFGRPRSAISP